MTLEELKKKRNELFDKEYKLKVEIQELIKQINKLELTDNPMYKYKDKIIEFKVLGHNKNYIKVKDISKLTNNLYRFSGLTVCVNDSHSYEDLGIIIDNDCYDIVEENIIRVLSPSEFEEIVLSETNSIIKKIILS